MESSHDLTQSKRLAAIIRALSILLFLLSLTQDAFYIDRPDYAAWASSGWLLLTGWLGALIGGGAALAWFANPLLIFSWVALIFSRKLAMLASTAAVIVAASFSLCDRVITSEAPTYSIITHRGAGYWLWLSSCAVFAIGLCILSIQKTEKD